MTTPATTGELTRAELDEDGPVEQRPLQRRGEQVAAAELRRCAGTQFDREVVRAFLDIGEQALIKIKEDMYRSKLTLVQAEVQAHEAEATLARLSEDLDDLDQTIPGPVSSSPRVVPSPPASSTPPSTGPQPTVVLSVLAGGRQGNPRD